jgi:hypothetical protein
MSIIMYMDEINEFASQIRGQFLGQKVERYLTELNPDGYRGELHRLWFNAFHQHINKHSILSEPPRSTLCDMVKISLFREFKDKPPVDSGGPIYRLSGVSFDSVITAFKETRNWEGGGGGLLAWMEESSAVSWDGNKLGEGR